MIDPLFEGAMSFSNPAASAKEAGLSYSRALLAILGDREPLAEQAQLAARLKSLVAGIDEDDLRHHEKLGKWSIMQVIQHLADTEIVTGYRIRMILAHDNPKIEGYDQDAWSVRLGYNSVRLTDALFQVETLREMNLRLLRSLRVPDWDRVGIHSERGPESVRRITMLVAGHDLVHLRQIERIKTTLGL